MTARFFSSIAVALILSSVIVSPALAISVEPANGPITPIDYIDASSGKRSMLHDGSSAQNTLTTSPATGSQIAGNSTSCSPYLTTYAVVGVRSDDVKKLQNFLNSYHRAQLPVTGYFGPRTKAAVIAFQKTYGIPATGNQMKLTTDAINALICQFGNHAVGEPLTIKSVTVDCPVYLAQFNAVGTRNDSIAALQLFLNVHERAAIPVTGYYGKLTKAGVLNFQKKYDIAPATGEQYQKTTALVNKRYCEYGGKALTITPSAIAYETLAGLNSTITTQPLEIAKEIAKKPTVIVTEAADASSATLPSLLPETESAVQAQSTSAFSDWVALFYALTTLGLLWVIFG